MIKVDDTILLRKPDIEDVDILYTLKNDAESNNLLGGFTTGYSKNAIREWIVFHNGATNECLYLIEELTTKKVIGHVGFYQIDHRIRKAEFAILIADKSCQGKGYGNICTKYMLSYGFDQLNLNRIELSFLENNHRALNLYEKHGFEREGVLKKAQYKNGTYLNIILMAKLNPKMNSSL